MKKILLFALVASLFAGCEKQIASEELIARSYFDRVLRQDIVPYRLGGVVGYTIRNYEVVNVSRGLVVLKLTYASNTGNDLVKTKRYAVTAGRLTPLDMEDVIEGVRYNLACVIIWAAAGEDRSWETKVVDDRVAFSAVADHEVALRGLQSQAGEDYRDVVLLTKQQGITGGSIKLRDGRTVSMGVVEAAQVSLL